MKRRHTALHRNGPIHSVATPTPPFTPRIAEPTRKVLVVDDEPMVRDLEAHVLRQEGYTVLEAKSAAEALRLAGENASIDLLVTDLLMSEVDGLELTRRFRALHPRTPVLVVSGSLPLLHARSEPDLDRFDFLAKPFHLEELVHKVRALLDAAAPVHRRKTKVDPSCVPRRAKNARGETARGMRGIRPRCWTSRSQRRVRVEMGLAG